MSRDPEQEFCDEFAPELYEALLELLTKLGVNAHVSYLVVEEIAIHFWRDIERLYAIHHEQVHVTKSCSYIAFWVRKLKPISDAYPAATLAAGDDQPPTDAEVTDINEQVAVHLSLSLLRNCIEDNRIIQISGIEISEVIEAFDKVSEDYLTSEIEDGMSMGLRFESMVYDMRFRTYGPHHLTHFLIHIMRDTYKEAVASKRG